MVTVIRTLSFNIFEWPFIIHKERSFHLVSAFQKRWDMLGCARASISVVSVGSLSDFVGIDGDGRGELGPGRPRRIDIVCMGGTWSWIEAVWYFGRLLFISDDLLVWTRESWVVRHAGLGVTGIWGSVGSISSWSIWLRVVRTIGPTQAGVLIHYNKNMSNICLNFLFLDTSIPSISSIYYQVYLEIIKDLNHCQSF